LYQQAELQITVEVAQAYYQYLGARKQVQQFDLGLLAQSLKVLEGKVYSYRRGESSLLEVLNAQRNYNDTQLAYHNAVFQYSSSLVELERAIGIWDIEF
jgi:cobalt-zinc-cadmium efflux system outer membrane protein